MVATSEKLFTVDFRARHPLLNPHVGWHASAEKRLCGLAVNQDKPFEFAISTPSHVLLMDARHTSTPVLSWQLERQQAPLTQLNFQEIGRSERCVVGWNNQYQQDTVVFPISTATILF